MYMKSISIVEFEISRLERLDHLKIGSTRGISIEFSERMWIWLWLFNSSGDEHEK